MKLAASGWGGLGGMANYRPSIQVTEAPAIERLAVCREPIENQTLKFCIHCFSYLLYGPSSPGLKERSKFVLNVSLSVHVCRITRPSFGSTFTRVLCKYETPEIPRKFLREEQTQGWG